jgi:hypothetical protein
LRAGGAFLLGKESLLMKRLIVLSLFATGLAGCRSQAQPSDPFLRTTVPPPTVGQGVPGGSQPYYSPSGSGSSTGGSTAPAGNKYTPPGGSYNYQQTSAGTPDTSVAQSAGRQSAEVLGSQLTETVEALDDPPPSFVRRSSTPNPTAQGLNSDAVASTSSDVQLAAHTVPVSDEFDPPPAPLTTAGVQANDAHDVVETGHHEETPAGAPASTIRIVGTKIINEPRAEQDAVDSAASLSAASESTSTPADIATFPTARWRKKGLAGQSYGSPAQFDRALSAATDAAGG